MITLSGLNNTNENGQITAPMAYEYLSKGLSSAGLERLQQTSKFMILDSVKTAQTLIGQSLGPLCIISHLFADKARTA